MIADKLSRVRFTPEKALLDNLFDHFGLQEIIEHLIGDETASPYHQLVMANYLRLTPLLAPRVFRLYEEVAGMLSFDEPVDMFVYPEPNITAFTLERLDDESPHLISLSSEMIRSMTDEELRFAIGHEIGHLAFEHHGVLLVQMMLQQQNQDQQIQGQRNSQSPQLLERRLDKWRRLAEFSADRTGFQACDGDLQVAVAAFFKMASGLGPSDLLFDIQAFCDQLDRLQSSDRREVLAIFSHPATPVRARALQLYSEIGALDAPADQLASIDAQIEDLAGLMDFELTTEFGNNAREFLLSAGLLAGHVDGNFNERKQEILIRLLLQVTGDPERHIASIGSAQEAEHRLTTACNWLRENSGQERFHLFGQIMHVVCIDGVVDAAERAFMMRVAGMLGISEKAAKDVMHDVHSQHVQNKATSTLPAFGFNG